MRALEAAIEELKDGGDDGNPGTAGGSVKRKAGGKFKIVRPGQVLAYGPTSSYVGCALTLTSASHTIHELTHKCPFLDAPGQ